MSDVFVDGVYYDSSGREIPDYRPLLHWSNWLKSFEIFQRCGGAFNFKCLERGFMAGHPDQTPVEDVERLKSYGWRISYEYTNGPKIFFWPTYDYGWNRIRLNAIDEDRTKQKLLTDRMENL